MPAPDSSLTLRSPVTLSGVACVVLSLFCFLFPTFVFAQSISDLRVIVESVDLLPMDEIELRYSTTNDSVPAPAYTFLLTLPPWFVPSEGETSLSCPGTVSCAFVGNTSVLSATVMGSDVLSNSSLRVSGVSLPWAPSSSVSVSVQEAHLDAPADFGPVVLSLPDVGVVASVPKSFTGQLGVLASDDNSGVFSLSVVASDEEKVFGGDISAEFTSVIIVFPSSISVPFPTSCAAVLMSPHDTTAEWPLTNARTSLSAAAAAAAPGADSGASPLVPRGLGSGTAIQIPLPGGRLLAADVAAIYVACSGFPAHAADKSSGEAVPGSVSFDSLADVRVFLELSSNSTAGSGDDGGAGGGLASEGVKAIELTGAPLLLLPSAVATGTDDVVHGEFLSIGLSVTPSALTDNFLQLPLRGDIEALATGSLAATIPTTAAAAAAWLEEGAGEQFPAIDWTDNSGSGNSSSSSSSGNTTFTPALALTLALPPHLPALSSFLYPLTRSLRTLEASIAAAAADAGVPVTEVTVGGVKERASGQWRCPVLENDGDEGWGACDYSEVCGADAATVTATAACTAVASSNGTNTVVHNGFCAFLPPLPTVTGEGCRPTVTSASLSYSEAAQELTLAYQVGDISQLQPADRLFSVELIDPAAVFGGWGAALCPPKARACRVITRTLTPNADADTGAGTDAASVRVYVVETALEVTSATGRGEIKIKVNRTKWSRGPKLRLAVRPALAATSDGNRWGESVLTGPHPPRMPQVGYAEASIATEVAAGLDLLPASVSYHDEEGDGVANKTRRTERVYTGFLTAAVSSFAPSATSPSVATGGQPLFPHHNEDVSRVYLRAPAGVRVHSCQISTHSMTVDGANKDGGSWWPLRSGMQVPASIPIPTYDDSESSTDPFYDDDASSSTPFHNDALDDADDLATWVTREAARSGTGLGALSESGAGTYTPGGGVSGAEVSLSASVPESATGVMVLCEASLTVTTVTNSSDSVSEDNTTLWSGSDVWLSFSSQHTLTHTHAPASLPLPFPPGPAAPAELAAAVDEVATVTGSVLSHSLLPTVSDESFDAAAAAAAYCAESVLPCTPSTTEDDAGVRVRTHSALTPRARSLLRLASFPSLVAAYLLALPAERPSLPPLGLGLGQQEHGFGLGLTRAGVWLCGAQNTTDGYHGGPLGECTVPNQCGTTPSLPLVCVDGHHVAAAADSTAPVPWSAVFPPSSPLHHSNEDPCVGATGGRPVFEETAGCGELLCAANGGDSEGYTSCNDPSLCVPGCAYQMAITSSIIASPTFAPHCVLNGSLPVDSATFCPPGLTAPPVYQPSCNAVSACGFVCVDADAAAVPCGAEASWGECSVECGRGQQQQRRVCVAHPDAVVSGHTVTPVEEPDVMCAASFSDTEDEAVRECTALKCSAFEWRCYLHDDDGDDVSVPCTGPDPSTGSGETGQWPPCSTTCGTGIQTRSVACIALAPAPNSTSGDGDDGDDGELIEVGLAETELPCAARAPRPAASQPCTGACGQAEWRCYPPGSDPALAQPCDDEVGFVCPTETICGRTRVTRSLACFDGPHALPSERCSHLPEPQAEMTCPLVTVGCVLGLEGTRCERNGTFPSDEHTLPPDNDDDDDDDDGEYVTCVSEGDPPSYRRAFCFSPSSESTRVPRAWCRDQAASAPASAVEDCTPLLPSCEAPPASVLWRATPAPLCVDAALRCETYRLVAVSCVATAADGTEKIVSDALCPAASRPANALPCSFPEDPLATCRRGSRCESAPAVIQGKPHGTVRSGVCVCSDGFVGAECDTDAAFDSATADVVENDVVVTWVFSYGLVPTGNVVVAVKSPALPVPVTVGIVPASSLRFTFPLKQLHDAGIMSGSHSATVSVPSIARISVPLATPPLCAAPAHGCTNGGHCLGVTGACRCPGGFTGPRCEVTPCAGAGCNPLASTCVTDANLTASCVCAVDDHGAPLFSEQSLCFTPVAGCDHLPQCQSGGRRAGYLDDVSGSPQCGECVCEGNWRGRECQSCALDFLCANGSPAQDCGACECDDGYHGQRCACRHVLITLLFDVAPLPWYRTASTAATGAWAESVRAAIEALAGVAGVGAETVGHGLVAEGVKQYVQAQVRLAAPCATIEVLEVDDDEQPFSTQSLSLLLPSPYYYYGSSPVRVNAPPGGTLVSARSSADSVPDPEMHSVYQAARNLRAAFEPGAPAAGTVGRAMEALAGLNEAAGIGIHDPNCVSSGESSCPRSVGNGGRPPKSDGSGGDGDGDGSGSGGGKGSGSGLSATDIAVIVVVSVLVVLGVTVTLLLMYKMDCCCFTQTHELAATDEEEDGDDGEGSRSRDREEEEEEARRRYYQGKHPVTPQRKAPVTEETFLTSVELA